MVPMARAVNRRPPDPPRPAAPPEPDLDQCPLRRTSPYCPCQGRLLAADSKLLTDVGADLIGKAEGGETRASQVNTVRATFDRFGSVLSFWPALWEHSRQRNDSRGEYRKP